MSFDLKKIVEAGNACHNKTINSKNFIPGWVDNDMVENWAIALCSIEEGMSLEQAKEIVRKHLYG